MRAFAKAVAALSAIAVIAASQPGPSAEGRWLTEKKDGIIEIFRCSGETLCGRLLWFHIKPGDPNQQGLDTANPKLELRNRPLCGLVFMTGFKPAEPGSWRRAASTIPTTAAPTAERCECSQTARCGSASIS